MSWVAFGKRDIITELFQLTALDQSFKDRIVHSDQFFRLLFSLILLSFDSWKSLTLNVLLQSTEVENKFNTLQ